MSLELHIYDFDGTLFRSPETPEGWDNRWWISSESLNPPCVPLDPSGDWWISKTVSAARASIANPDTYAVMMTGRPVRSGFRYRVPELLKSVGLKFDEVYLSDTNNTPAFKIKVIKNLLGKFPGVEKIVFWDDNAPYLARYVKLVEGYGYQAEANLVTVPAMECDEVPAMGEGPFRKEASEQIEVMKFLSAVARNAGIAEHVYVVGGAVRNFIIGQPIKDVDVVIDSVALRGRDSAWFARKIADSLPCESSLVTNNYGVAILTIKGPWILNGHDLSGEVIEIANARKESYGGDAGKGYKPNMVEPATIQEDVVRREFTFNTLLWRLHDLADGPDKAEIIDLSGCGLRDLQSGTMRCPNDPDIVFSDDPSRMVRAIKFLLKYGFRIDPEVAASIKRNAVKLKRMPAAHLSMMLVETFFEPGVGKKALLEMDKLGLLDVVREIAQENKPFRAALDNWANKRSGLEFLFDLLDLQMPMGKRLSVVPQDLLPQFRAYSEAEPDKAVALLEVLDQPGRKFDMPRLIRELGISGAEIKDVTNTIRRLLVLNPDLTEADLYRKLIQGRATQTAAISDKHIDFNLARKGSGMNKVAQAVRVAARWALMKNAAPLKDVKHLRYQAVFLMGAAGSGKSYVGYRWMKYLPGPGGVSTTTREQFEAPAHKRNVFFSEEERKLSKLDFNRVRDSLDKLGFDIEITTHAKAKIPFLIYSYDSNGKERMIPRDQWGIEIPEGIYSKIKDMEELEFAAAKNEFPSFWRTINPDVFKEEIPGYDTELPGYVHEMSSKMNNVYFEAAIETGDPIFVDSVGQNEKKMARWLEAARKKGYRVQLVYVSVPLTVNLIRNLTRGREVNSMIIVDQWKVISRNFEILKRLANKARKIDNRNNSRDFAIYKQNAERINDTILRHTNGEYPTLYDLIAKVAPQELDDYGDLLRQRF